MPERYTARWPVRVHPARHRRAVCTRAGPKGAPARAPQRPAMEVARVKCDREERGAAAPLGGAEAHARGGAAPAGPVESARGTGGSGEPAAQGRGGRLRLQPAAPIRLRARWALKRPPGRGASRRPAPSGARLRRKPHGGPRGGSSLRRKLHGGRRPAARANPGLVAGRLFGVDCRQRRPTYSSHDRKIKDARPPAGGRPPARFPPAGRCRARASNKF